MIEEKRMNWKIKKEMLKKKISSEENKIMNND